MYISMYSGSIFLCTQVPYLYVLSCGGEILWSSNLVPLLCPLGQNSTCNWKCQSDIQYCTHSSIPNFTMVQENTLPSSIMIYCRYTRDYTTHISPVTNVTSGGRGYGTAYVLLELYSFYVANIDSWECTVEEQASKHSRHFLILQRSTSYQACCK